MGTLTWKWWQSWGSQDLGEPRRTLTMHALLNFSHIYLLFSQLTVLRDVCIYQVSLLLSVLALAGSADGESERVKEGERGEEVKRH